MRITLILACILAAPWNVLAQDAGIVGTVTDGTGGVLPGVTVEAAGGGLAGPMVAVTDGDGRYAIAGLPAGAYVVTFALPAAQGEQ